MRRARRHPMWAMLLNPPRPIARPLSPLLVPYVGPEWLVFADGRSAGPGGPMADITALITALGGNAVVPAFYDGRLNVTSAAGVASVWQDARGPGFGPNLTAAGAAQPSYVATDHLVFDGVNNQMVSAAVPAFDLSQPISLVFVASSTGTAGQSMGAISDAGAGNIVDTQMQTGPNWGSYCGGHTTDAGVLNGTTIRVLVLTYSGTTTTAQVPNHAKQTSGVNAGGVGNQPLTLGTYSTGQAKCPSTQYSVFVYAGVLSSAQVTTILTWAVTNRGAVAAS